MSKRRSVKYVHEGKYVAEVDAELLEDETEWSPYLSVEDTYKLDDVRAALKRGDTATAAKFARVFELQPVAVLWRRITDTSENQRDQSMGPNSIIPIARGNDRRRKAHRGRSARIR